MNHFSTVSCRFLCNCVLTIVCLIHLSLDKGIAETHVLLSTIEYPPLFQKEKIPGKGFGIARDLATEAFNAAGYQVSYHILPMARCTRMNKQYVANVGAINWFKNANMMDRVLYANVTHSKFVLFYKKETFPDGIHFEKLEDLKKYGRIGNVRGSSTTKIVQKAGLNIDWASSLESNFKKLQGSRFDVAISIQLAGWTVLQRLYPDELQKFDCCEKAIFDIPISVTFLKENQHIYHEFMKGLRTIVNKGRFLQILNLYYGSSKIPEEVLAILKRYQCNDMHTSNQ